MQDAYKLNVLRDAEQELLRLPPRDLKRVVTRLNKLKGQPRPRGCEKLSTLERYRIRQSDYRVLYEIDDKGREIVVVKIAHRSAVYRRLRR